MLILSIVLYVIGDILMILYWHICKHGAGTGMGAGIVMVAFYIGWIIGIVLNMVSLGIQTTRIIRYGHDEKWYLLSFAVIAVTILIFSYRSNVFR